MDVGTIKACGTPEELKKIEELCKAEGISGEFDANGVMDIGEDYTFCREDVDDFMIKLISAVPNAKIIIDVSYNDDVSDEVRFSLAEYDTEKMIYKDTYWYDSPVVEEDWWFEEEEYEDEFTYLRDRYMWRAGAGRPDEQDEEDGDGFIWYGKKYKWDFIKETVINDKH